jgi:hypothetical protein
LNQTGTVTLKVISRQKIVWSKIQLYYCFLAKK